MPQDARIRILIIGAGKAGGLLLKGISHTHNSTFEVIGFIDDDINKQNKNIHGTRILGKISDLKEVVKSHEIDEIFIAIPSERGRVIRSIIENTAGLNLVYKILPRLSEVLLQDFEEDYLKYVRKVRAEDLLGGEILKSDQANIKKYTRGQVVLITGAAGSIGSELSRQLAAYGAKKIVFYDWWENGMFDLRNQIIESHPNGDFEYIIGDAKDKKKLDQVVGLYKPTTIFHAAAYKHVPLMESNPAEAVKNNIVGTKTVAEIAIKHKVEKFILVSSDKAVNPTNVMGATKRAAEKVIHVLSKSQTSTIFCAVRFGNVINSNGSAIPTFIKQIEKGGPVTVTHKEVTRFFMTIPEAVHLILQSWVMGENNDLFVLDMGESIKIYDLARLLIILEGYVPEVDIDIDIVGLRPGEKLYEEVLVKEEETAATSFKKIFRTQNHHNFDRTKFERNVGRLLVSIQKDGLNIAGIKTQLKNIVSTYKPKS